MPGPGPKMLFPMPFNFYSVRPGEVSNLTKVEGKGAGGCGRNLGGPLKCSVVVWEREGQWEGMGI